MRKRKQKKEPTIAIASSEETTQYGGERAEPAGSEPVQPEILDEADGAPEAPAPTGSQAECDAWRDKALRAKADFQNLQRRAEVERRNAVRFANTDFARSLLVILDDIGRTLEAGRQDTDRETLLKSVEILNDHFTKILGEHHVTPIDAQGKPFDPAIHQAMVQQPRTDHDPGTVVDVIEVGYMLHDRVLRPAKVVVSCAPPDASASEGRAADAAEPTGGSNDDADV